MPDPESFTYIGRKRCGCVVAMVVDLADKVTADAVAEFIKDGLVIERVTTEAARTLPGCKHSRKFGAALL